MKLCFILIVLQVCWCLPVEKTAGPPPKSALDFMKQYGYLKADQTTSAALLTEDGLSEVIKKVQKFGALQETGTLDNATLKLMTTPRCGNADVLHGKRSKRFTLTSGWNKRHITFYVANWSSKLGEEVVARLIGKALNTWGAYANLKFTRKSDPDADIIVSFARGPHNDPFPFDGPGYVLAHAYFPNSGSSISGDIHFDDDENWVHDNPQEVLNGGTDFYSVALHELGHSLGLGHSTDPTSVMFAYYKGDDETTLQLSQDDILAMYQLYIVRSIQETTQSTTAEPTRRTRPLNTRPPNEPPRTRPTKHTTRIESTTRRYTDNTYSQTRTIYTRAPPYRPTETERTRTYHPSTFYPTARPSTYPSRDNTRSSYRPTETERTRFPSTYYPTNTRSTDFSTRSTFTTASPSTLYPTGTRNEETRRTTHTIWSTTAPPVWKEHTNNAWTTSLKSNNRFPSTVTSMGQRNEDPTRRWSTMAPPVWKDHTNVVWTTSLKSNNKYPSTVTSTEMSTRRDRYRTDTSATVNRNPSRYPIRPQGTTLPPVPNICEGKFDSVANLRGEIFVFKNEYIWRLQDRYRFVPGYPVLLRQMFPHLPENVKKIDAAYQRADGNMVLFTGDLYWVYDGSHFVENSPRSIRDYGVPLGLGGIDAVQTWARNGKTYLYAGDRFGRYNETSKTPDPGYPQPIDKWRGIPRNIDAAMTWKDGVTYFFKDDQYWTFDNNRVIATSDSPRSATREWFGCA